MQNIFKFEPKHLNHSSLKKIHIILENLQITLNTFQDKLKNSLKKIFDSIPSSISKLQTPRPNISPNQRGTSSKNFVSKEPVAEENARISSHSCVVAYLDNGKGACKGSSSLEREHAPPSPPLFLSLSPVSLFLLSTFYSLYLHVCARLRAVTQLAPVFCQRNSKAGWLLFLAKISVIGSLVFRMESPARLSPLPAALFASLNLKRSILYPSLQLLPALLPCLVPCLSARVSISALFARFERSFSLFLFFFSFFFLLAPPLLVSSRRLARSGQEKCQ